MLRFRWCSFRFLCFFDALTFSTVSVDFLRLLLSVDFQAEESPNFRQWPNSWNVLVEFRGIFLKKRSIFFVLDNFRRKRLETVSFRATWEKYSPTISQ